MQVVEGILHLDRHLLPELCSGFGWLPGPLRQSEVDEFAPVHVEPYPAK